MARIAVIGAGGFNFPIRLCRDVLYYQELKDADFRLMDVHAGRNRRTFRIIRDLIRAHRLPATVSATTDLERALEGADYVIVTWQVGGLEAYRWDVEIPRQFGLDQPVGDTMGPGGIFRGLRSIPAYEEVAGAMKKVCPDALMLNYANPMAINCLAINHMGIKCIGLCHSVQGTSRLLASELGIPYEEMTFKVAGYNHQAWFTELVHKGRDAYPELRRVMDKRYPSPAQASSGTRAGRVSRVDRDAGHGEVYHQEKVRTDIMRTFGYFHTESSHHGSEYVPWFRKNAEMVGAYLDKRWDYYEICCAHDQAKQDEWVKGELLTKPLERSEEYASIIIHAMESGVPQVVYGTVPNWGEPGSAPGLDRPLLIPNLPADSAVELACLVDRNGIRPVAHGPLPTACAAINRAGINVHQLTVEASTSGDPARVHQAVAMDPLTGALLTLPQIREMTDLMLRKERQWLPQFFGKGGRGKRA